MLEKLRNATEKLHREIEKDNLAAKIMDGSISLEAYKLLLLQNYIAYKVCEKEIKKHLPDWYSDKNHRLEKDLEILAVDTAIYRDFEPHFAINSYAEALGAAYVIEGSALGGMQIRKAHGDCPAIKNLPERQFFTPIGKPCRAGTIFLSFFENLNFRKKKNSMPRKKHRKLLNSSGWFLNFFSSFCLNGLCLAC